MPAAELVQAAPTGARIAPTSQGTYALYTLQDGGLHLAYRPVGANKDEHIDVPAFIVKTARNMAEGKGAFPGPLGKLMGRNVMKTSGDSPAKQ